MMTEPAEYTGPWAADPGQDAAARLALEQRIDFYTQDIIAKQQARERAREKDGSGGALAWRSLTELMKNGVRPPTLICADMLYAGGLHSIAGAADSGKTTTALWWGLQLMRGGERLVFMDEEGGPEIVTEKLAALGAESGDLDNLFYVPFPGRSWTDSDVLALHDLACAAHAKMILWDSSAAFLARAGLDENSASDVTNFWSRVLTPLARDIGAAVVVIDHDTKSTEQSRYARGSSAKLAACDVAYKVEMLRPFTRSQDGVLRVVVTKDRRGWLHRTWKVNVRTGGGHIDPCFAWDDEQDEDRTAWPATRHKVYELLGADPQTTSELVMRAGYTGDTVRRELECLVREGYARRQGWDGNGRAAIWSRQK